jgi:hypothetical protein
MQEYIIELLDQDTRKKSYIVLDDKDVWRTGEEAEGRAVTSFVVERIREKAKDKGFVLSTCKTELYEIAKKILTEGGRAFSLVGQGIDAAPDHEPPVSMVEPFPPEDPPLFLVHYRHPIEEMETLVEAIRKQGNIPVVWNGAQGLVLHQHSRSVSFPDSAKAGALEDPRDAIRFIIRYPQTRVQYIFEDFHHFIGDQNAIHPGIGEIRALLKVLCRTLRQRDEKVYFFVPYTFELPVELRPFIGSWGRRQKRTKGILEQFGQQLNTEEYLQKTKPIIGAKDLIERVIQILAQMEVNNPLLVGHPGVGKTAIVEGLAWTLIEGRVPEPLRGRRLYLLSLNRLVAGTKYRGEFEQRLEGLLEEVVEQRGEIIVFIDEIHTLVDAGAAEGAIGAGEILKTALARGRFPCIGATTFTGAEYLARDPALSRRFKKVVVKEPTPEESLKILRGISRSFEKHHRVKVEDDALVAAVSLTVKHLTEEYLPGKAISVLDAAAAYCSMKGSERVSEAEIWREMKKLI